MKILAIGDLHGKLPIGLKKNVDLILLTGDIGKSDLARKRVFENIERKKQGLQELEEDKSFIGKAHKEIHYSTILTLRNLSKIAHVYSIQGNVGLLTKTDVKEDMKKFGIKIPSTLKEIRQMKRVNIIKNVVRRFNKLRIGFLEYFVDANWVKEFKPSNYKDELTEAKKETNKAKKILKGFDYVDILVCHQPPYRVLDKVSYKKAPKHWKGKHAGSQVILNYIKRYHPRYVICGHIHEAAGERMVGKTKVINLGMREYRILDL